MRREQTAPWKRGDRENSKQQKARFLPISNGGCFHTCTVEFGNVRCGCTTGFELEKDGKRCRKIVVPVDSRPTLQLSCADRNGFCSHVCSDEEFGGVRCSCPEGFRLLWNNRACEEISISNEFTLPLILETRRTCAHRNGFCSQMCSEDEHRGVRCSCREGFKLLWDKITCDEVSASTYSRPRSCADSNGFCSQVCSSVDHGVRCSCLRGFQLLSDKRTCVDIDECSSGEFECFQCVNTPGSYECLCPEGFVDFGDSVRKQNMNPVNNVVVLTVSFKLTNKSFMHSPYMVSDTVHLSAELVEPVDSRPTVPRSCADSNGFCSHVCREWHSDIQCSCPEGFRLLPDRRTCVDVDECANSVLNKCDHDCHNTEGGYSCSCRAGYISYDGFKCEGCRKNSYKSVTDASCIDCPSDSQTDGEGKTSVRDCVCKPGFTGNPARGIPCKDINECAASDNFGCSHNCLNVPGSAICTCSPGFQLQKDQKTCSDIDECSLKNGGCDGVCHNTVGNFTCSCDEGYVPSEVDRYSCVDVDECKENNGGCMDICENFQGGYQCLCSEGYHVHPDGKSCIAIHCPKVYVPHHSSLRCKDNPRSNRTVYRPGIVPEDIQFPVGALCKVKCDKGYDLHPSSHPIICQNNGKWNATPPECQVLQCPPLLPPEHGDVYPPSCKDGTIQVKEKCIFTCLQGFRITGQEVFTCNNNLKWDVKNGTQCLPETDAFIVCPEDITVELMPNETSTEIFLVPPKSNIEPILVRPDWISLDRVNFFPAEETKVMFYVEDSYNKAECNISVFVIDKEPPFFLDCPETLSVTGSGSQGTVVDWQEPIADDNVGIASITKTLEPNSTLYSGIHLVQYVARDFAGNMGMCSFEINITSEGCSELADPLNGEANCFEWTSGMICTPLCDTNFTRPPEEPEFYTCEDSGTWTPSDFISPCLPESSRHPEQTGNLTDLVNE
ncbi:sushi, von Willebrand factor type A, EGF and pentraxin domain-containing protein 1 [Caerostris darwini]|uniref:Sushi, von Willebrand factor type A, EGF and pentraxin domain-containing protein 1 n=1 Tax=Caerostris darwini TaxID=1538125 RepID=A0AAV4RTW7_9ARAC|nr:sushi, von Willebrand factor type A, EGF and pentraxin domain-containing protein 1 [Caerostris darwini]